MCFVHYNHRRELEKKCYRKHRLERIAATLKWIESHRTHVNNRQRLYRRKKYREDAVFRERMLQKGKETYRKHIAKYTLRNAIQARTFKQRARMKLQYAVRTGRIIKPPKCDVCGNGGRIDGHHYKGYKNPYNVIWLCTLCHGKMHFRY